MSKLTRDNLELLFSNPGALRAEDIAYDVSQSIKTLIDILQSAIPSNIVEIDDTDSPYTASYGESILADATNGAIIVNLPTSVGFGGQSLIVKKMDSSANTVTLDGNGTETIDKQETQVLSSEDDSITVQSADPSVITNFIIT